LNLSYHQKILLGCVSGLPAQEWCRFLIQIYGLKVFGVRQARNLKLNFHPKKLKGFGIALRAGSSDVDVLADLLAFERYLPEELNPQPKFILDLGANIGCSTAHFASLFPEARIFGVELETNNYELALQNTSFYGSRITLINGGVWSSAGRAFFSGINNDAFSICPNTENGREVTTLTVDELIDGYGIPRLDYVKIDIEGAEQEVLLNCEPKWLEKVLRLSVEIHNAEIKQKISQRLASYGFRVKDSSRHWCGLMATRVR